MGRYLLDSMVSIYDSVERLWLVEGRGWGREGEERRGRRERERERGGGGGGRGEISLR